MRRTEDEKKIASVTIDRSATIREALESLESSGLKLCLVAGKGGRLLGTLSDGDIRKALLKKASLSASVCEAMNRNYTFVTTGESRSDVLELMKARRLTVIPILDGGKRIAGVHTLYQILGSEKKPNAAVIMAGGRGERLRPLTDELPKPMIKVAGKPIIERLILHLMSHGIRKVFIAVNYKRETIMRHFGDGSGFGVEISYIMEEKPLGTAGALGLIREKMKDDAVILNGDLITQADISSMLDFHRREKNVLTVGAYEYMHAVPFGVLGLRGSRVTGITEKPVESWPVNSGIYVVSPGVVSGIPKGKFLTMPELIGECLAGKARVGAFKIDEEWHDIGRHAELEQARKGRT